MNDDEQPPTVGDQLRQAWQAVAQPLAVLLTRDQHELRGATVASFTTASLEPPTIACSISRGRWVHEALAPGTTFSLSLLAAGQEHLADHYASSTDRSHGVHTVRIASTASGAPCLAGSLAVIEARVEQQLAIGDQTLLLGLVTAVEPGEADAEPLLWHRSAYAWLER